MIPRYAGPTVSSLTTPRWLIVVSLLLALFAVARGGWLVLQRPMIGLANSYDEVRYSSCFDLGPIRPGVPAAQFNPQAPLRVFGFTAEFPADVCVWTSDLLFTAPVAYGWKLSEKLGAAPRHSIGKLGLWRLLIWCAAIAWFTRGWLGSSRPEFAIPFLACTGIVFMDPANTILFNTWYAEPAATFGLFLAGTGALLLLQTGKRMFWAATAFGAAMLAASKMQHILLPLLLAATCVVIGRRAGRVAAGALLLGGMLGATVSALNATRAASQGIELTNRGNYVLMVLLPHVAYPSAVAAKIGLDRDCAAHAGPHGVWGLPGAIEQSCPSMATVSSLRAWAALAAEPRALASALEDAVPSLLPWVSNFFGMVEGREFARLPADQWTLSRLFGESAWVACALLALPCLVLLSTLLLRAGTMAKVCAAICVVVAIEVPIVAMMGDGYGDFNKHVQLAVIAALCSLCVPLGAIVSIPMKRSRTP